MATDLKRANIASKKNTITEDKETNKQKLPIRKTNLGVATKSNGVIHNNNEEEHAQEQEQEQEHEVKVDVNSNLKTNKPSSSNLSTRKGTLSLSLNANKMNKEDKSKLVSNSNQDLKKEDKKEETKSLETSKDGTVSIQNLNLKLKNDEKQDGNKLAKKIQIKDEESVGVVNELENFENTFNKEEQPLDIDLSFDDTVDLNKHKNNIKSKLKSNKVFLFNKKLTLSEEEMEVVNKYQESEKKYIDDFELANQENNEEFYLQKGSEEEYEKWLFNNNQPSQ